MATILIVDDLASEAQLMAGVVTSLGHHPVIVNDGESALSTAKTAAPALILLDVVMQGLNGFETCRKLKRDAATSNIPVVIVSTKDQETDKFWATKQGANGYVVKPFSPVDLSNAIRTHLR
jgi:twitching motility two-component system response regulator PilH